MKTAWRTIVAAVAASCLCHPAAATEGALARCGASKGAGYFFHDEIWNPSGPEWTEDGLSNGKIVLIRLGDEWDILFDDTLGASGYRNDGAGVLPLGAAKNMLTVGVFHPNYSDIFTFDFEGSEVVWTSHKIGTPIAKVAIYRSECSFMSWPGD